jgi:tRNA 5-methylaminomethyl-2-thiouridine biosynthesis bifunctional protein
VINSVVVIGAGLAGAACAYALAKRGCEVTVLHHGEGASHLPVGLLAAHLSAQDIELSQLSRIGLQLTLSHARTLLREGIDWQPCTLEQHLLFTQEKNARLRQGAARLPDWYEAHESHVIHKIAAWVKPQALVKSWLAHSGISLREANVQALRQERNGKGDALLQALDAQGKLIAQASCIIVAAGAQAQNLLASAGHQLVMANVDGSVAFGDWPASEKAQIINGNGHFIGGVQQSDGSAHWLSGSTYDRETYASEQEREAANLRANQARLSSLLPAQQLQTINAQFVSGQVQSWQGSRCTSSDRLPAAGEIAPGLYASTAMGSRGLSFAALCAELLTSEITGSVAQSAIAASVSPQLRQLFAAERLIIKS